MESLLMPVATDINQFYSCRQYPILYCSVEWFEQPLVDR